MTGFSRNKKVIVVLCAFCVNALTMGPIKCVGVYFLPFQVHLKASAKKASLVTSLIYGMYFFCGPLASISCNRFGYRNTALVGGFVAAIGTIVSSVSPSIDMVYGTLGIFIGLGASCALTPIYALIGQLFSDKRPLVNNVVSLGSALAAIPLGITVQTWIDEYGWRGSVLLLGGVLLNSIPAVWALMVVSERSNVEMSGKRRKLIDANLLRNWVFDTYCIACGLHMASMVCISVYLVRYAQSIGVTNYQAAALTSIIASVDICLRPLVGYATSVSKLGPIPVNRYAVLTGSMFIQSFVTVFMPFAQNYAQVVAVTVAYSTCIGFCGALPITVLADLFGSEKLASTLGLRSLVVGSFSLATPPLVGIIVDAYGTFDAPFYASSGFSMLASLCLIAIKLFTRNKPAQHEAERIAGAQFVEETQQTEPKTEAV